MKRIGFIVLLSALIPLASAAAQDLLWTRQAGTARDDTGYGVAVDSAGNAYVSGVTRGRLGGPMAGGSDAFLARYDASGTLLWTRQFGSSANDSGNGVAVDGAGNAYVSGITEGSLGGPNSGRDDAFLAKFDATRKLLWRRQFGTSTWDQGSDVAVDGAGNAYVTGSTWGSLGGPNPDPTGQTSDVFLAKYDASGNLLWTRQAGTSTYDYGIDVAVDGAGNAYVTGSTGGSLGGPNRGGWDYFLTKYDTSGNLLWARQTGTTAGEGGGGVAVDGEGNAYIFGGTAGSLGGPFAGGHGDVFLAKYSAAGVLLWTRQAGTSATDNGYDVAVDGAGNAYVTGDTNGSLGGPHVPNVSTDIFLAKYETSGALLWIRQIVPTNWDYAYAVAVDGAGNAYVSGETKGRLGGPNAGGYDYFLAKFGCYADCDQTTGAGVLDVFDFLCFQNSFVNAEPYACDCDTSTGAGVCDVFDFLCFQDAFVGGCP